MVASEAKEEREAMSKVQLLAEKAPLADQESLEEEEEGNSLTNGNSEHVDEGAEEEDPDQLQHIVVVKGLSGLSAECEVSSIDCQNPLNKSKEIKVQISQGAKHKNIEESPINQPIIIQHRAQVLQDPGEQGDVTALEKLPENSETPHSFMDPSRSYSIESELSSDENNDQFIKRNNYSVQKKVSQDLIVTVETTPDQELKVTEKLPEVLLVAEQLPRKLRAAKNILASESSKEKEPTAPPYESSELDEGCSDSTLTVGRADTVAEVADILTAETGRVGSEDRVDYKVEYKPRPSTASDNESCISPFFIGIYSFLGVLIVIMIGLNFWFGFHLLFFIGLLAVIALFSCVLTEFNDFHNEPD